MYVYVAYRITTWKAAGCVKRRTATFCTVVSDTDALMGDEVPYNGRTILVSVLYVLARDIPVHTREGDSLALRIARANCMQGGWVCVAGRLWLYLVVCTCT